MPGCDLVIQCLPAYLVRSSLEAIGPHLKAGACVGTVFGSTGFFYAALEVLPNHCLFAMQRVPFIARVLEYGSRAEIKGYKKDLLVRVENSADPKAVGAQLEELFDLPVRLAEHHLQVTLSNSNPLLHTARMYTMWKDYKPGMVYPHNPDFYCDWTVEASRLLLSMDEEFQQLVAALPISLSRLEPVLEFYEAQDAASLTEAIAGHEWFVGIKSPMRGVEGGWAPDFDSRYFVEDFLFGMHYLVAEGKNWGVSMPQTMEVYRWGYGCVEAYSSFRLEDYGRAKPL